MNDKWKKSLDEEMSPEFEQRVLGAMRPLLRENAELHASEKASRPGLRWLWIAGPGLAAAGLVVALSLPRDSGPPATLALAGDDLEIAMDLALYKDLRVIENLELLQKLGDTGEWPKAKSKPRS